MNRQTLQAYRAILVDRHDKALLGARSHIHNPTSPYEVLEAGKLLGKMDAYSDAISLLDNFLKI